MDEGVDRSACVEVVVFTTLQDTQLELAIELVDDRLPSISQFNNLIGHAAETAHYIHTSTHCADLSILHSQDKYKSLAYVSIFGDSNCWVVRTWEDLELVINPYKVGPAEMLTWRVWPYFSACARHNSVRRNILGHFLLISIALEHRHRPIFPLNMGLFSFVTPLQWHPPQDSKDVFVLGSIEDITVALEDSLVTISTIVTRRKCFVRQNKTRICRICYLLFIYLYHRPSTHIVRISTQIILHGETLWCCDTSLFSCRVT